MHQQNGGTKQNESGCEMKAVVRVRAKAATLNLSPVINLLQIEKGKSQRQEQGDEKVMIWQRLEIKKTTCSSGSLAGLHIESLRK